MAELILAARAALAEGPCWHADTGTLTWVDIEAGLLHRLDPATGGDEAIALGEPVGFAQRRARGGLVLGLEHRVAVMAADGSIDTLAPIEDGDDDLRLNDGKPGPSGHLFCGSLSRSRATRGSLYRVAPTGAVERLRAGIVNSNGIGFSPDGRRLYHVDTAALGVDVLAHDPATGAVGPPRRLITVEEGAGKPDGLAIDAEGGLWVCLYRGGAVRRYAPDGSLDRVVGIGAANVTCCAFGGPGLRDLFVTTAAQGTDPADDPHAGGIFRLEPGVAGLPVDAFG